MLLDTCLNHEVTDLHYLELKMPTVRVETNLGPDFFPDSFMPMFIVAIAELLGKDKRVMKYVFDTNKNMTIVSVIHHQSAYDLQRTFAFLSGSSQCGSH